VEQGRLLDRLQGHQGEFVIWDVGLGAAANILTVLHDLRNIPVSVRVHSFDHTLDPLRFAYDNRDALGYFHGYESIVEELLENHRARPEIVEGAGFVDGSAAIDWQVHVGDFPSWLGGSAADALAKPHLILFDPWSPAKNPAMWTAPLFGRLHALLDPARPCILPTYSRSTLLRVALLLAGFWVGVGQAAGRKEETTIASNRPDWIERPLDQRWLERAGRSSSAEPLKEGIYLRAPLSIGTREQLHRHPQFQPTLSRETAVGPPADNGSD
jgi:tRNA U34 5-methylaminomethyl-2-thiouridine-forming methyltransferase MnmC